MNKNDLQKHFDAMRKATEQEIKYLQMAQEIVETDLEIEIEDIPNVAYVFTKAVQEASHTNARIGGDAYKSYDPDLAFPTKDVLKPILQREMQRLGVKPREQKAFKF
jgi:hypothetical protein